MKRCVCECQDPKIPGILMYKGRAQRCDACQQVGSDAAARKLVKRIQSLRLDRIMIQVRKGMIEKVYASSPAEMVVLDFNVLEGGVIIPGEDMASLRIRMVDQDYIEKIFSLTAI